MKIKVNFSDLVYEAHFKTPLFVLAGGPVKVLEALHASISPKYPIASGDMVVDAGKAVGEVRARVALFGGSGTLEVASDFFTARFNNPRTNEDFQVIQDCVILAHDGLSNVDSTTRSLRDEGITLRLFAELADGSDASVFLRSLFNDSKLLERRDFEVDIIPGFVLDLFQDAERWSFNFSVSQAARSKKEMFVATNIRFFAGNTFSSIKEKGDHFAGLLKKALVHVNLEPLPASQPK